VYAPHSQTSGTGEISSSRTKHQPETTGRAQAAVAVLIICASCKHAWSHPVTQEYRAVHPSAAQQHAANVQQCCTRRCAQVHTESTACSNTICWPHRSSADMPVLPLERQQLHVTASDRCGATRRRAAQKDCSKMAMHALPAPHMHTPLLLRRTTDAYAESRAHLKSAHSKRSRADDKHGKPYVARRLPAQQQLPKHVLGCHRCAHK
jgi:hypothetical protein